MLRFRPIGRFGKSIHELAVIDPSKDGAQFGGFASWFRPGFSDEEATAAVKAAHVGTWLIRLSPIRNGFTRHWHATESFPPLVCRVRYDGMASERRAYSAVSENDNPKFAGSSYNAWSDD
jgi:hypothetical protein